MTEPKRYVVKECFRTIQGEGFHAGTPAVFLRMSACNMWSGRDEDRERDAARNGAQCPRWCDTDFMGGERLTAEMIVQEVVEKARVGTRLVVITGGEPLLQVDRELLTALLDADVGTVAIETNGTVAIDMPWYPRLWLTLSPKVSRARTRLTRASELKLVVPAYDPAEWEDFECDHRYVQPQADRDVRNTGNELATALWAANNPPWRLSLQTHKIVGVR